MEEKWIIITKKIIEQVITERQLYKNAIFLAENKDKSGGINSYSICIWEKGYPDFSDESTKMERNGVIINIKTPALANRPTTLKLMSMDTTVKMPTDIEKVDNVTPYWIIEKGSANYPMYIKSLIDNAIDNYVSRADVFGCCSKYNECSDAGKCLHENLLYSKACSYRHNLETGRVFYGAKSDS